MLYDYLTPMHVAFSLKILLLFRFNRNSIVCTIFPHSTVLILHFSFIFFTKIVEPPKIFSQPMAGLTNQDLVQGSQARAPWMWLLSSLHCPTLLTSCVPGTPLTSWWGCSTYYDCLLQTIVSLSQTVIYCTIMTNCSVICHEGSWTEQIWNLSYVIWSYEHLQNTPKIGYKQKIPQCCLYLDYFA